MTAKQTMIAAYVRMWPREVYKLRTGNKHLESVREKLRKKPGIYILYQSGQPYYVGQAKNLWLRIANHALNQNAKHYHLWTHFSAFIVQDVQCISELEGLLIAALGVGTANSACRRMSRIPIPLDATRMLSKL